MGAATRIIAAIKALDAAPGNLKHLTYYLALLASKLLFCATALVWQKLMMLATVIEHL
jgi:hypothetical protein